jgi:glutamine amidotransferase
MAYVGAPIALEDPLFVAENSLVRQSVGARLMSLLNIGGFGLVAWDAQSREPERPFVYRTPSVPVFDRNLRSLAEKVEVTAAIAHVRGVVYDSRESVGPQNLHPFRFGDARVVLAQNGDLYRFGEMRYDLVELVGPELARHIEGTTDTEWVYALVLSRLADPFGPATCEEIAAAALSALELLRDLRAHHGIATQSPVNLVVGDGSSLVVTRFCFDYGWYPNDASFFAGEREFDFTTLWYTVGENGALVASEPLVPGGVGWLEAPEYSMLILTPTEAGGLAVETRELA